MTARRRVLLWGAALALGILGALVLTMAIQLRAGRLRQFAELTLARKLHLEVSLEDVALRLLPRPEIHGAGLVLRVPNRPDLQPFVSITRFSAAVGLFSALRKHVDTIRIEGLTIVVPPSDARQELPGAGGGDGDTAAPPADGVARDIIISHLITRDAVLTFTPKKAGDRPLRFEIHELALEDLGFETVWPFSANLTNPVPKGLVTTSGRIGPFAVDDPAQTPLSGDYTLSDADLGTINGIGGILQSTGHYEGRLDAIRAGGTTTTPDFSLDLGGKPLPLDTTFKATIDGTDGSVRLDEVQAKLRDSAITATGAIVNLEGPAGHDIRIDSEVTDGRIEDMLALALDAERPLLEGDLTATSALALPPGDGPARRRLKLNGRFGLKQAEFNSTQVREKLRELSRRSQGKDEDEAIGRVLTNLGGRYAIENGVVTLTGLTFDVPGARIALDGTYSTVTGALDFHGTMRMEATVSEAVGGFKSIFIKPFDGLFKKDGAGAVIPIKIEGTKDQPKFGVEMGKILK